MADYTEKVVEGLVAMRNQRRTGLNKPGRSSLVGLWQLNETEFHFQLLHSLSPDEGVHSQTSWFIGVWAIFVAQEISQFARNSRPCPFMYKAMNHLNRIGQHDGEVTIVMHAGGQVN